MAGRFWAEPFGLIGPAQFVAYFGHLYAARVVYRGKLTGRLCAMCVVSTYTEAGGHVTNEDAFLVQQHPADPSCWVCLLADGQGGRSGGAAAARLACRTALDRALALPPDLLAEPGTWVSLLRGADEAVRADREAGYCTLVGLAVTGDQVVGASSGDSAAWLVSQGQQVHDLTARQVKHPPVGSGVAVCVPFTAALQRPWLVLMMSDGVWKYVGVEKARELALGMVQRGQALLDALLLRARLPGSGGLQDDFTAVVLQGCP